MSQVVGGLRRRLIKDNFYWMVHSSLSELGWFNGGLSTSDVTLLSDQVDPRTEIKPNKVSISAEELSSDEIEMGSNLEQYNWDVYLDIFAEDESVGIHLTGDIYDILRGKIESIGRTGSSFDVYDLRIEDEPYLFTCQLENIEESRVREWDAPFNKYWWVIAVTIVDTYYGEGG
jgi:hypothetical protein